MCSRCCCGSLGIQGHHPAVALAVLPYPHTGSRADHHRKSRASTWLATTSSRSLTCLRQLLTTPGPPRGGHPSQHKAPLICPCQPTHSPSQATLTRLPPLLCRHHLLCQVSSFLSLHTSTPGVYQHQECHLPHPHRKAGELHWQPELFPTSLSPPASTFRDQE